MTGKMHQCSNNLKNQNNVYLYSFVISIILFFGLFIPIINCLENRFDFPIPVWVETPSIIGIYYSLITLFDELIWKYKWIKYLRLPLIPNLNGNWSAEVSSGDYPIIKADVKIIQTFSKFSLVLKTSTSSSVSKMASFDLSNPIKRTISYQYLNKPKSKAVETLNIHEGTGILEIDCNENKLSGYYYSGRGRETHGDISLERTHSKECTGD